MNGRDITQKLLEQLWVHSDNGSSPIEQVSFLIHETCKSTGTSKQTVIKHFDRLIERGFVEKISDESLVFQFTDMGRKIKSANDIEGSLS